MKAKVIFFVLSVPLTVTLTVGARDLHFSVLLTMYNLREAILPLYIILLGCAKTSQIDVRQSGRRPQNIITIQK